MGKTKSFRKIHWTPFWIFLSLAIGVFIGFQLYKYIGTKRPITTVVQRNDRLADLINLIDDQYVDSVSRDTLYQSAIDGVLKDLDPFTLYFSSNEAERANSSLEGEFKGIGIQLISIKDTLIVQWVVPQSPAFHAGVKVGDRLVALDSVALTRIPDAAGKVTKILKNQTRPTATLSLIRNVSYMAETIVVKKGAVPLNSIDAAYMIQPRIGYIRIARFSAFTFREFKKNMDSLVAEGMQKLILDLRDNPGGYVEAATAVANQFLGSKKLLVYTEGRAMGRENYFADNKAPFADNPLVVLVNGGTASAAEILAGAIQDWDRGSIVGQTTFGKGLVQQQFDLGDGSMLRLTVARYFTPSGRNIQKPFSQLHLSNQTSSHAPIKTASDGTQVGGSQHEPVIFYSKVKHRPLKGGGGIVPDFVTHQNYSFDPAEMTDIMDENSLGEVTLNYFIHQGHGLQAYKTVNDLIKNFQVPNHLMDEMKAWSYNQHPKSTYYLWQNPFALDYIRFRLKAQLIKFRFGDSAYFHFLNEKGNDQTLQKGLQLIRAEKIAPSKAESGQAA